MTDQQLYRLEQMYTTGWEVIAENVSKEECKTKIESCLAEGISPSYLRVTLQQ